MPGTPLPMEQYTVGWFCGSSRYYLEMVEDWLLDKKHYESEHEEALSAHGIYKYILGRVGRYNVVIFLLSPGAKGSEILATKAADKMKSDFTSIRFTFTIDFANCCHLGVSNQWNTDRTTIGDVMICSRGIYRYRSEEYGFTTTHNDVEMPPEFIMRAVKHTRSIHYDTQDSLLKKLFFKNEVPTTGPPMGMPAISYGKVVMNTPSRDGDLYSACRIECHEDLGNVFYPEPGTAVLTKYFPGVVIRGIVDYDSNSTEDGLEYHACVTSIGIAKYFLSHIEISDPGPLLDI